MSTTSLGQRLRATMRQLVRFGLVGGLGVLVNMGTLIAQRKLLPLLWASARDRGVWFPIPFTGFSVRWYHVMVLVAFLVANLFNFQLNRWWTFNSFRHSSWWREYWPFLVVGLVALALGQVVVTALMWPGSPLALPTDVFDSSTGFRTPLYWANLIMIALTVPVSFLLNKYWTFRSIRQHPNLGHDVDDVVARYRRDA